VLPFWEANSSSRFQPFANRTLATISDRYFVDSPITSDSVVLSGPEAHHLARVMRVREGERVTLFDSSGWEFVASVQRIGRQDIELAIISRQEVDRELPVAIHLGAALPKGDRQAWLVEKAVELGVASLTPLKTERGVAQPVEKAISRLQRSVIEASKQCGRNRLMQITQPQSLDEFVHSTTAVDTKGGTSLRWLAHPGGQSIADALSPLREPKRQVSVARLAIGPEGGFSEAEVRSALSAGWQAIDLGPRILRVETAAIWLCALVGIRA
jgi:16S rRNA (uracil1498-N3)-methyltransferase